MSIRWLLRGLALVCATLVVGLAVVISPALAAGPEAPETLGPQFVAASETTLEGILDPGLEGEPGTYEIDTYEFLYKASKTECEGGAHAPEPPGVSLGAGKERVSQYVAGLKPGTEYTVCLVARDSKGQATVGSPVTFKTAIPPERPETKPATGITATTATLHGVLNPEHPGDPGTYLFRYRASASECEGEHEQSAPEPEGVAHGQQSEAVEVALTKLLPATTYTFCLWARNDAFERSLGQPVTFTTPTAAPAVSEETLVTVGSSSAKVSAEINPGGLPSSYHVEYVSDAQLQAHGWAEAIRAPTPDASLPGTDSPVTVLQELSGLQPGTLYHFRFLASNQLGTDPGADMTFTAIASVGSSSLVLPDERTYELVSPPENPGEVYVPNSPGQQTQDIGTEVPFRASADGNAVVYAGDPPASGGTGNTGRGEGDEYLAVRGERGWVADDIEPYETNTSGEAEGYEAFSPDLSVGIVREFNRPPGHPAVTSDAPPHCNVLYTRINVAGSGQNPYSALYTKADSSGGCGLPLFAAASEDDSHLLFQDEAVLAPGAEEAAGQNAVQECQTHCNLYDSVGGQLRVVNILPHGEADPNAVFGSPPGESNRPDFSNVISADGSRIFWTDLNTNLIYVREDALRTVQISAGPARFWTASRDGRYVFYTEGEKLIRFDLHRFDASGMPEAQALAEAREELAGAGAEVQGVIGTNETGEEGAYVYFVAAGALAPGAEKRACETVNEARARRKEEIGELSAEEYVRLNEEEGEEATGKLLKGLGCNLYLFHPGEPVKLVGVLAKTDNALLGLTNSPSGVSVVGDWQANLGARTAEVTSDGRGLVFESTLARSLTGYNNDIAGQKPRAEAEVFVYDAGTGHVSCASCVPSGASPATAQESVPLPSSLSSTFMRRWISEDGSRVFFGTSQALVPQDTNGVQDVYEWEREGTPGCPAQAPGRLDGGCVSLLSGGGGTDWSWLVDASASGGDVFFATRAQLAVSDRNEKMDLYDARVNGGFPEVKLSCTGTGCQGVPPAPPIFATPSSVTFSGVGNFEPAPKASVKPKRKATKCKKGRVRKHGKCVKPHGKKAKRSGKRSSRGGK
jgi:hypothetical protein